MQSVHRVMYDIFHGPIPADKEVHHTCGVRNCCNIAHLALVSHRQNVILTPQYTQLRWKRLQALVETHPDLALWGITHVTSTDLWSLWGASCRGANLTKYLDTIAAVFPEAFSWSFVRPGRGRRPHLFEIRMSQTLIDQLIGDEESTASAATMASLVLAV
jgi:HNH endonuclease